MIAANNLEGLFKAEIMFSLPKCLSENILNPMNQL